MLAYEYVYGLSLGVLGRCETYLYLEASRYFSLHWCVALCYGYSFNCVLSTCAFKILSYFEKRRLNKLTYFILYIFRTSVFSSTVAFCKNRVFITVSSLVIATLRWASLRHISISCFNSESVSSHYTPSSLAKGTRSTSIHIPICFSFTCLLNIFYKLVYHFY